MKIYLAAPLFTAAEKEFNKNIASVLHQSYFKVFLPQEECLAALSSREIFETCVKGIDDSDVVLGIVDGADADSGTCWEIGYSYATGKKIVLLRTDFRGSGDAGGFNAMLCECTPYVINSKTYLLDLIQTLQKIEKDLK